MHADIESEDPRIYASVLVRDESGRVLLVHAGDAGGRWRLPGGGVAQDELPHAVALREVEDQTSLYLPVDDLLVCDCTPSESVRCTIVFDGGTVADGTSIRLPGPLPGRGEPELTDYTWARPDRLMHYTDSARIEAALAALADPRCPRYLPGVDAALVA